MNARAISTDLVGSTASSVPGSKRSPETGLTPASSTLSDLNARVLGEVLATRSRALVLLLSILCLVVVGLIDFLTGPDVSLASLYLVPVVLAAWYGGSRWGVAVGVIATCIWCASDIFQRPNVSAGIQFWNACSRLTVFLFAAYAVDQVRAAAAGLERMVLERTNHLQREISQRLDVERQIATISDRERQHIGHELHDGLGQHLAGIAFRAKALEQQLASEHLPQSREAAELTSLVSDSIRQARLLARGLDPLELHNHDIVAALQSLAAETQKTFGIPCVTNFIQAAPALRVTPRAGLALYRICQEAMSNAVQHGRAKMIQIELAALNATLTLRISDDGVGFHPEHGPFSGMGLGIMKVRATSIGGTLETESASGTGTRVVCTVPLDNTRPADQAAEAPK